MTLPRRPARWCAHSVLWSRRGYGPRDDVPRETPPADAAAHRRGVTLVRAKCEEGASYQPAGACRCIPWAGVWGGGGVGPSGWRPEDPPARGVGGGGGKIFGSLPAPPRHTTTILISHR